MDERLQGLKNDIDGLEFNNLTSNEIISKLITVIDDKFKRLEDRMEVIEHEYEKQQHMEAIERETQ